LHYLIVPKSHIKNVKTLPRSQESLDLLDHMNQIARKLLSERSGLNTDQHPLYRIGFHRSFATSQDHLHLHAFLLPCKTFMKHYLFYAPGMFFSTIENEIEGLRKELE